MPIPGPFTRYMDAVQDAATIDDEETHSGLSMLMHSVMRDMLPSSDLPASVRALLAGVLRDHVRHTAHRRFRDSDTSVLATLDFDALEELRRSLDATVALGGCDADA